jgi:3-methylcrotonyl-CoA carboxylase beta subunit
VTGLEARGEKWQAEDEETFTAPIREQGERRSHPYYILRRPAPCWRRPLSACADAPLGEPGYDVFRM